MAVNSGIEWTETTWNPVTGCNKVSPGCKHCYAETMARRLKAMGQVKYRNGFDVTLHMASLEEPARWKKPRLVFVNSMSDLFHDAVPDGFIQEVFTVMAKSSIHTFQVLTKRPERVAAMSDRLLWTPNIWMGVSVENADYVGRIDLLKQTGAHVKFLSLEPLLGPLPALMLDGIDWVITGGESGPHSRFVDPEWILDIRLQCVVSETPFFFKQWGGTNKKKAGRLLDGQEWNQMPQAYVGELPHG